MTWLLGRRRPRGRRLVDGRLVEDDSSSSFLSSSFTRRIYYGRLVIFVGILTFLVLTNPANQPYLNRYKTAWRKAGQYSTTTTATRTTAYEEEPRKKRPWFDLSLDRVFNAYELLVKDEFSLDEAIKMATNPEDSIYANYVLFSVKEETRKLRRLQLLGAGGEYTCRITHSFTCRMVRNALLPTKPVRKPKNLEHLEQLFQLPLNQRRYFHAYRILLVGVILGTFLITLVVPNLWEDIDSQDPIHVLLEALTRGLWPNPQKLFKSTAVTVADTCLFMAPALAVMDDLITHQSQQSWFRWSEKNNDRNYALSVIVLLLAASASNLVIMTNWSELFLQAPPQERPRRRQRQRLPFTSTLLGYSCDLWAACALGYLRGCKDPHFNFLALDDDWRFDLSTVIWLRVAFQILAVSGFSFSLLALWFTADAVGFMIGEYQVQHHFVNVALSNVFLGMDRFLSSLFGPI